jgi:hypothetical protein
MVLIEDAIVALFEKFMKGTIMKKLILTAVAFAALSGVAVAGEREHDSRLIDPNYSQTSAGVPAMVVEKFSVLKSDVSSSNDAEQRRLDSKNGYTSIN